MAGMIRFAVRRIFHAAVLLVLISLCSFALLQLAPGDYVDAMRLDVSISPGTAAALRSRYGLDRSLPSRYFSWWRSVVRGEFGVSFAYGMPVGSLLWPRMKNTLLLAAIAAIGSWFIGILLGIATAITPSRVLEHVIRSVMSALLSTPDVLIGLALLLLAVRTGLFPIGGMGLIDSGSTSARARDVAAHLVLPVTALVLISVPVLVRYVEAAVRDALRSPFIQAARAHGIAPWRILTGYALAAAANPLISLFGYSIGGLVSSSLLVEVIMGWPGLGSLLLESIFSRDVHVVIGATLVSALFLITGNLIADLLLYATDPRIRVER
jgi:peptide/nickel transport system permease protein